MAGLQKKARVSVNHAHGFSVYFCNGSADSGTQPGVGMNSPSLLTLLGHALFALGVYGVLTRRNAIGILLSIELILNAAALNFVSFGRLRGALAGQTFALFIIALAACEAVVGLAIIIALSRTAKTIFADQIDLLKG